MATKQTTCKTDPTPGHPRCICVEAHQEATKYARQVAETAPDEVRTLTLDEVRRLPGLLGRVATAMVERHGVYAYTANGRKVLIRLSKEV